jgi:DNA-binding XRE family transcriptional regulator
MLILKVLNNYKLQNNSTFVCKAETTCSIMFFMEAKDFKRKRGGLGLSQAELAEILDVKPNTISRYETGLLKIPKAIELAMETVARKIDESDKEAISGS